MIKNEREFKISKSQATKFRKALVDLEKTAFHSENERLAIEIQRDAIKSQLDELEDHVAAYEKLTSSPPRVIRAESLEALPTALIQARIASGLTQSELAQKLGLKEQQIQRYEASDYTGANLRRLEEISNALGIRVEPNITLPDYKTSQLFRKLSEFGLDRDFVCSRLLPKTFTDQLEGVKDFETDTKVLGLLDHRLREVYGWTISELAKSSQPVWAEESIANVRFKNGNKRQGRTTLALTVYAHYIGLLALQAAKQKRPVLVQNDPNELYAHLVKTFGKVDFRNTVQFLWDCGIPVIPLNMRGGFHAAVWRANGRNVIVLKQQLRQEGRWLIDLLHEACHTTEEPESMTFSKIDLQDPLITKVVDANERRATRYALIASLGQSVEKIIDECVEAANGKVENLKRYVPIVAERNNVHIGVLANAMAYRLARNSPSFNWWPTATVLQKEGIDPFDTVRQVFFENVDKRCLNQTDWDILTQALEE